MSKANIYCLTLILLLSSICYASRTPEESTWKNSNAQLGINLKTGNSSNKDYLARLHLYHRRNHWRNFIILEGEMARDEGILNKEKAFGETQLQYHFLGPNHVYWETHGNYDKFNPYLYQVVTAVGYGRTLYKSDAIQFDVEAGPGYMTSKAQTTGKMYNQFIADLESNFRWQITHTCSFHQSLIMNIGAKNTYTRTVSSLRNNIFEHLGIQISYALENNSRIPPGSKKNKHLDTITDITAIYNF